MWDARNRRRESRVLEARLRSARPTPPDELVRNIAGRVTERRSSLRPWSRLAFAAALTTLLLGTFASFGGIGYAASGAAQAVGTFKTLSTKHKLTVHSAADSQYPPGPPETPTQAAAPAESQVAGAAAAAESRTLPFTGISLLGTVLAGLVLMAIGIALRRRERSNS